MCEYYDIMVISRHRKASLAELKFMNVICFSNFVTVSLEFKLFTFRSEVLSGI